MRTAISIPDDLFADVERLTRRLGKSRSELYTDALREYVTRHERTGITDTLNRVIERIEDPVDPAIITTSEALLRRVDW
jgi:metal-responsive CopG/Arc/MetJ family transcriptional regulator